MLNYSIEQLLTERQRRIDEGGCFLKFFNTPESRELYSHWIDFMAYSAIYKERLAMCGNQVGKTTTGMYEVTCHMTGLYPQWWTGQRKKGPNDWWLCGTSQKDVREVLQERLLGKAMQMGTGFIPKHLIDFASLKSVKKAETPIGSFRVKHVTGGWSYATFKSYEQGREAYQGKPGINLYLDEEAPLDVYTEAMMRTISPSQYGDRGLAILTFTPSKGLSEMVLKYLDGADFTKASGELAKSRFLMQVGQDKAYHLTDEDKAAILLTIPEHLREARTKGIPALGSGAIYPFQELDHYEDGALTTTGYVCEPFDIPAHWPRCYGFDVGANTAIVWLAFDRDNEIWYAYSEAYFHKESYSTHASAIKSRGKWIRGAIDTSAHQRSQTDGDNLFDLYIGEDLLIQNADKAVDAGIMNLYNLFTQGRLKIFSTLTGTRSELKIYRRDEKSRIVKINDHRVDALRYGIHTGPDILWTEIEANHQLHPTPYEEQGYSRHQDSWALR